MRPIERFTLPVLAALAVAWPACKQREAQRFDALPRSADAGGILAPPAKVELPVLPVAACERNAALARGLEKVLKVKPKAWHALPGRFPDPGCAVLAFAGEGCDFEAPNDADEEVAIPRRLLGVMDPTTGVLRAGQPEERSGMSEVCFSQERIWASLDLDGDGSDEVVTRSEADHREQHFEMAHVFSVRNDRVSKIVFKIGSIPISYEVLGEVEGDGEQGASPPSCAGTLAVLPAGADGGPALELTAKVEGRGQLTKEECLPGRRRFRVAAGKLVATKLAGRPVKPSRR